MTKRQICKDSGYSRPTVDRFLKKGLSPDQIIAEGKSRHKSRRQAKKKESFIEAQGRKEIALADLRELELKEKRGELVRTAEVNLWIGSMIIKSREILMRMAPELKDRLSQESDPFKVEGLIDAEVRRALDELAEFKR